MNTEAEWRHLLLMPRNSCRGWRRWRQWMPGRTAAVVVARRRSLPLSLSRRRGRSSMTTTRPGFLERVRPQRDSKVYPPCALSSLKIRTITVTRIAVTSYPWLLPVSVTSFLKIELIVRRQHKAAIHLSEIPTLAHLRGPGARRENSLKFAVNVCSMKNYIHVVL